MMVFSQHPIYSIYELAPPPGGDALGDQQFAGAIMKIGSAWILFVGVVVVFKQWVRSERDAEARGT
jgi:cytochrome c oxidase assembly factor CtaG